MKQGKAIFMKAIVTVTIVAGATTKVLLGLCDFTVDSDVGMRDFSLVLRILHACGHAHVRLHISPGMDCNCVYIFKRNGVSIMEVVW